MLLARKTRQQLTILEQTENKGLENIQEAITLSLNLHPSIIYMEEDLEVSQNFLRFMNDQLMNYRDDSQVFSVAGYSLPCFDERGNKILASESFTAWGCGLWKNKMDFMNNFYIQIPLHNRLKNKLVAIKYICQHGIELYIHYLKYSNLKKLTPDLKIGFYLWSESKVQIFPADSLVRIHGHDGSGWHCEASEKFSTNKDINESLLPVHQKIENKNEIRNNYKKIRKFHNIGIEKDLIKFIKNPFFYIKKLII